jgi:hypothetical protein
MADFDINSPGDVFDSRDVIERWDELDGEHTALQEAIDEASEALEVANGEVEDAERGEGSMVDLDAARAAAEAAETALKEAETAMEEWADNEEWAKLKEFVADGESYAEDWLHGATFIADSYFEEYAQELAEDIGAVNRNVEWPYTCIDWERAARELKSDYTAVEIDGATYWVR